METNEESAYNNLLHYKNNFTSLQAIAYKDLFLNGLCLRNLGIHYMDCDPNWSVKNHKHSFYEFHYVTEGYTFTTINQVERKISEGSFYLMVPGTYHAHRQDPEVTHTGFALRWEFIKADLKPEIREGSNEMDKMHRLLMNATYLPVDDGGKILLQMVELLKLTEQEAWILPLQLAFCRLLINIADFYNDNKSSTEPLGVNKSFLDNQIVREAINFMEENYSGEIDVEDVAHSIHLSYSHLARLFKLHTGDTLINHLNKVRLSKAQKLLKCSDKTIAQIAREVGIGNDQYFCTLFKRIHGVSPGNYRINKDYDL